MCPSGRSVVCHTSRRHGRRTPKTIRLSTRPKFTGRRTDWDEVTVSSGHRSNSPVVKRSLASPPVELPCHQTISRVSTRLHKNHDEPLVLSRFNVPPDEPLTSVNSTTSVDLTTSVDSTFVDSTTSVDSTSVDSTFVDSKTSVDATWTITSVDPGFTTKPLNVLLFPASCCDTTV